jgi:hypothetical protein
MLVSDAKKFVGFEVEMTYSDRNGDARLLHVEVFDVTFVPLYGPCVVTDQGDFRLDRITHIVHARVQAA